jgi:hypothetical protein
MINISESVEDNSHYFFVNFDEYMSEKQKEIIEKFYDNYSHFFDNYIIENNYVMFTVTNLVNPDSVYNIRKRITKLKESLLVDVSEDSIFSFSYNKQRDCHELIKFPLNCPSGYHEDGDKCSIDTETNVGKFPQCEIGFKWHSKLSLCLPTKNIPNVPEGYYWDFESHSCLRLKEFKHAKLREYLKNAEIESLENNLLWKVEILGTNNLIVDCSIPEELRESFIYNFYQYKWKSCKVSSYINIGNYLRDNLRDAVSEVKEDDGVLMIKLSDKEKSSEVYNFLINDLRNKWNELLNDIKEDKSLLEVMYKEKDKIYLKLEDSSTILVKDDIIELIKN